MVYLEAIVNECLFHKKRLDLEIKTTIDIVKFKKGNLHYIKNHIDVHQLEFFITGDIGGGYWHYLNDIFSARVIKYWERHQNFIGISDKAAKKVEKLQFSDINPNVCLQWLTNHVNLKELTFNEVKNIEYLELPEGLQ